METAIHSMGFDIEQTIQKKMDALLGFRQCEVVTEACPYKSKAGLEEY
jgi:hypothetical protein